MNTFRKVEVVNPVAAKRLDNLSKAAANVDYMVRWLRSHWCVDCGNPDPDVLQFDHVRGIKKTEVTALVYTGASLISVIKEIEKCEVRCANCHCKRHAIERRNNKDAPNYRNYFLDRHPL